MALSEADKRCGVQDGDMRKKLGAAARRGGGAQTQKGVAGVF